jgi:hypothetical protein
MKSSRIAISPSETSLLGSLDSIAALQSLEDQAHFTKNSSTDIMPTKSSRAYGTMRPIGKI